MQSITKILKQKPVYLIVFTPLLLLAVFVAMNYSNVSVTTQLQQTENNGLTTGLVQAKQACPVAFECCEEGNQYLQKSCPDKWLCSKNQCLKKECTFECCDDESSKAEFKVKACANDMLCEDGKCVPRLCWKECCIGLPNFEEKQCPEPMECIDSTCVKPACPDNFQCCAADDSRYREKKCKGNAVCKSRVCRSR